MTAYDAHSSAVGDDSRKRVAIAVPVPNRPELMPDEEISLCHLHHYLAPFDKFAIAPEGISSVALPGCKVLRFPRRYFGSTAAHAQLMLSPEFYETFSEYDYVLTYHLDALVFAENLLDWCDLGFDFIGGPWRSRTTGKFVVGNGGFALRRVKGFLRLLRSSDYAVDPDRYWKAFCAVHSPHERLLNLPRKYLKRLKLFNSVQRELRTNARMGFSDDTFLADGVPVFAPWFRIAPVEVALKFSFNTPPRACFEANGRHMPFGCHAWFKADREFWAPYLLSPPKTTPATTTPRRPGPPNNATATVVPPHPGDALSPSATL